MYYSIHTYWMERAHAAGMALSVIALLGAGGTARSEAHAEGTARLVTAMDPEFFSALTLTVIPGTPMARMQEKGLFELPDMAGLLRELRVDEVRALYAAAG